MSPRLACELAWRRHGWPLAVVVALAVLAVLVLRQEMAVGMAVTDVVPASDGIRQVEARQRAFRNILLAPDELEARQAALVDGAMQAGLVLGRIDYVLEPDEAGRFERAHMAMPLRGDYAAFRRFVAAMLEAQPALALEECVIQRDPEAGGIVAELKWTFMLRHAPGGGA